ncbi:MAG TPA: ligase-associated DNA damage response endonuclease PdeM [Cyclobacteriaceae bacterium]|nr:ligase-associated DNA damage response endonuclease PdeM [Cyclobacteriaceae bacterium]
MLFSLKNFSFQLLSQKALYWPSEKILLVADLHLGKVNHYRQAGYPVPTKANDENTSILIDLLNRYKPERMIFLGDLFHSHYNEEWEVLGQVIRHFASTSFELVMGNHDIMSTLQYDRHGVKIHPEQLLISNLLLTHKPMELTSPDVYNLVGHIHPGARLYGKGRQALLLPCFYFGRQQGILPAFGSFTGLYPVRVMKGDQVFVIADGEVISMVNEAQVK